jgi:hypothetical protein
VTLEIRQLVLKSTVSADGAEGDDGDAMGDSKPAGDGRGCLDSDALESQQQLKEEILAECRAWMQAQWMQVRER